jgi:Bacterial Ig-like domain (group 3)
VTFTVTIAAASGTTSPTGTVRFSDGFGTIGSAPASASGSGQSTATLTLPAPTTLPAGSLTITADYGGDANFNPSTTSTSFGVGKGNDLTAVSGPSSSTFGQPTTFTITVSATAPAQGTPTGTVAVRAAGTPLFLPLSGGTASFTTSTLPVGPQPILASYNGDNNFTGASAASFTILVSPAGTTITLTSSTNPSAFGQPVTFTATVSGPAGVGTHSSQAFNGVLKGDGWTAGAYLGWKLAPNLRLDAGGAWSDLLANGVSGTASGHFTGTRWLVNGGLTGTYPWQMLVLEPSARVFALWEHEHAYTHSLGTFQPARNFETGRASVGAKAVYPSAWTWSAVVLSPYAGLYADYYFSKDDAQTAGLTTVPLLQGFSARATGGVAASFAGGATLGAGGEFGGLGSATHIWTWTARGRIPF